MNHCHNHYGGPFGAAIKECFCDKYWLTVEEFMNKDYSRPRDIPFDEWDEAVKEIKEFVKFRLGAYYE